MPPVGAWDGIQSIRRSHDKGFYRWMPHINILYPFYEDRGNTFEVAASQAERALRALRPFPIRLSRLAFFEHSARSSTVWAGPDEGSAAAEGLEALHAALLGAFPECTDLSSDESRGISRFAPHLSLGGWPGSESAKNAVGQLAETWDAAEFVADSVYFISRRSFDDSFRVRWEVPLGGYPRAAQEVNKRYAAAPPAEAMGGRSGRPSAPRDTWARRSPRPALGQSQRLDMGGLPWGLFAERRRVG